MPGEERDPTLDTVAHLATFLANQPGAIIRLLTQHVDDGTGGCRGCPALPCLVCRAGRVGRLGGDAVEFCSRSVVEDGVGRRHLPHPLVDGDLVGIVMLGDG
jgi:hypothetical protein